MSLLLLLRTNAYGKPYSSYWSDHFPRKSQGHSSHWNYHFPDEPSTDTPGTDPEGAATFALTLESETKVTFAWRTGLFKSYSGKERRQNLIDDPAMRFEGKALLVGDDLRTARSRIASYAALGRPFQLGLPYEELALRAKSTGAVVAVHSTARADWAVPGQRVVVRRKTGNAYQNIEAVIQSTTATTITIDKTLGDVGALGASIMPTIAVYLEPQQGFQRYVTPDGVEHWALRARCAVAGFASSDVRARLSLASPKTTSGALTGLTLWARDAGAAGNSIVITQNDDALTSGGELVEDTVAKTLTIKFMGGLTTAAQYFTLISNGSSLVRPDGTYTPSAVLASTSDEFAASALSGGANATPCSWGLSATVATFAGSPIWDRGIDAQGGSADDSVHTMAQVQDLGGLPFAAGSATMPDWGRRIAIDRARLDQWQWVKKFLDTVKGRWKSFWLPTMRPDLVPTAKGVGTLTVESGESDVAAWYPLQRGHLMVREASGTITYLVIADAIDNHNGTHTLSIRNAAGGSVTLATLPELVCWLERCRLESDEVQVQFADARFAVSMLARAVQQDEEDAAADTLLRDEGSVEEGRAREAIRIEHGSVEYLIATGTRNLTIGSDTFTAQPAGRGEIRVTNANADADEMQIHLPVSHPFCRRWLGAPTPPQLVNVTIYRYQILSGESEIQFAGEVLSVQPDGHTAVIRLISTFARALLQRVPSQTVGRTCSHLLGDENCRVNLNTFKVSTTVSSFSGRSITVASVGGNPTGWFDGGHVTHTASGEKLTISVHNGSILELQHAIYGLAVGDAIDIFPGCAKTVAICASKFNNADNFSNPPLLPVANLMRATGFGVIRS